MEVFDFASAADIASALLRDQSVVVPAYRGDNGQLIARRVYDFDILSSSISERDRRRVEWLAMTDPAEAGEQMRRLLTNAAHEIAYELWTDWCEEGAA